MNGLLTLHDFERAARARLSHDVWDFVSGGSDSERSLAGNLDAFSRVRLLPRILTGSGIADTTITLFGRTWAAPIGVAPCAYHTLAHPDGEIATMRAAAAAGLPLVLSMYSGKSFKELQGAAPAAEPAVLWQQLYCLRERSLIEGLIRTAEISGVEALVLTVDAPHLGHRLRDLRNEFRLPPGIAPANLDDPATAQPSEHARTANDPALDWSVVDWLRGISTLPLLLKGVLTARDAARAVDAGVDGIIVSNHGGRQLDGVPATLEALPAVVAAVARRIPVLLDGGIRTGTDVLSALSLGADTVLVGRPVLHGLAVDGQQGANQVLNLLKEGLRDAMTLAGIGSVGGISAKYVDSSRLAAIPCTRPEPVPPTRHSPFPLDRRSLHSSLSDPNLDTMAFLNEIADRFPDAISFAPGRPYEGFFKVEDIFTSMWLYIDELVASGRSPSSVRNILYQYGPAAGIIRDLIALSLREDEGIETEAESIVVTVGAQEGMLLVLRALFAEPEDVLLVATPCYVGIVGAAKLLGVELATVAERINGLHVGDVGQALREQRRRGRRPRALYLVPDHSNPSGNTLDLQTRKELIELARREQILLLEDSPYRLVSPGTPLPTLKALDNAAGRAADERVVVHIGSFAKSAFPGARVGYVVADQPVSGPHGTLPLADELARIKSMVTVNTPTLSQAAVAGMLLATEGRLSELNAPAAAHYGENLRVLLEELAKRFPQEDRSGQPTWDRPSGGFFLAMRVPFRADNDALSRSARDHGVLWTPMSYFYPFGGGEKQLRLSFSALDPDRIRDGVARLGRFIEAESPT